MAFTIHQSGSTLYALDQRGSQVSLTLPTGVVLDSTLKPRFAVFGNYLVIVNSPSRPITVDANLNVRVLCPSAPAMAPTVAASSGSGNLTGSYKAAQTFRVRDAFGRLIAESDYGPTSSAVTLSADKLALSALPTSSDTISSSGLYRTTNGESVLFPWAELDSNTQTTFEDDVTDAGLQLFAGPRLGTPPDMYLIAEFRSRLFGVAKSDPNSVKYSEIGRMYAWPSDNSQPSPRFGSDSRGITGFVRKRDALGFGRTNGFYEFSGTSDANFRIVNVSENCGIEATDSISVYRDVAWFLWKDGVYQWDSKSLVNVSDGAVRRWFTDNSTFNLGRLQYAFGLVNEQTRRYKLYIASAGSNVEDCWVEYDFINKKWWGPHTSHAMNPTSAFLLATDSGLRIPAVGGSNGYVHRERKKRIDDDATAIDFDLVTNRDNAGFPRSEKHFGQLTLLGKPQETGKCDVQTVVGSSDTLRQVLTGDETSRNTFVSEWDMRKGDETLNRVGNGQAFKIRVRNNHPNDNVSLRGYAVDPVFVTGSRR